MRRWPSIAEYTNVLRAAMDDGWFHELAAAHFTPCTREESSAILAGLHLPNLVVQWRRGSCGRASRRRGQDRLTLPRDPLAWGARGFGHLRVGIVLHEAAHIINRRENGAFGHGEEFQRTLRRLVEKFPWRCYVAICSDYPALYARHRGPYSLLLTTETTNKKGEVVVGSGRNRGPMSAEDAHDTARMLITDPRDNVRTVHVYSDTEQQYIGAYYDRGQVVPSWADASATSSLDSTAEREGAASLPPGDADESLPGVDVDVAVEPLPEQEPAAKPARPARTQPAAMPRVPPAPRKAAPLAAAAGATEWPKSRGPQIIREWFAAEPGRQATVPEITAALGPALTEAGIQFPTSLISRLKQGGFLVAA